MKMIYPHEIGYTMIFAMVGSSRILSDADTIKGVPESTPIGYLHDAYSSWNMYSVVLIL